MTEKTSESSEFFHKAERSLRAAITLAREGLFDDSVSRAYYAAFQAASGALLERRKRFKSHNGLHAAFAEEFVREGPFDREMSRILGRLYERRFVGDYGDYRKITEDDALRAVADAARFLATVFEHFGFDTATSDQKDRISDGNS